MKHPGIFFTIVLSIFFSLCKLPAVAQNSSQKSDIHVADSLFNAADFEKAERRFAAIAEDKKHPDYYYASIRMAECLLKEGSPDKAEQLVIRNLKELGNQNSTNYKLRAKNLEILGLASMGKGENDVALKKLKEVLELYREKKDKSGTASALNNTGLVYWNLGNREMALEYLQQALALRKEHAEEEKTEIAGTLNNMGLVYLSENPEKAESYFRNALTVYKNVYSENHPSTAVCYNNIAIAKRKQGKLKEARENLLLVNDIWITIFGTKHPNVAFVLLNLGEIEAELNTGNATEYYSRAIEIYTAAYGKKHPDLASAYNLMGHLHMKNKAWTKALACYQKALSANVPGYDTELIYRNPAVKTYYNPDVLLHTLAAKAEALEACYTQSTLRLKDLQTALRSLQSCDTLIDVVRHARIKKEDKLELGSTANEIYEHAIKLCFALYEVTGKRTWKEQAFYFSEKSKASVLQEAISEADAKKFAKIPERVTEEEKSMKAEISTIELKLASAPEQAEENDLRNKLFSVNTKLKNFTASLEKQYPEYYNLKYNFNPVSVEDLQAVLDGQSALCSYFIAEKSERVFIFRISKKDFQAYDVPRHAHLDKNIKALRNSIIYQDEVNFVTSARVLYKQLFPARFSDQIKKLVIIPDGALNTIPFEVLLHKKTSSGPDGFPYLVKEFAFAYNLSASLYHQSAIGKTSNLPGENNVYLCAPVTFNYKPEKLASLPATKHEIEEISALFNQKGYEPMLRLGQSASEAQVKSKEMARYRYIHFATHGLVNETSPELSQIYLSADSSAVEDGHLYAGEIYNLELNSELVTLSACQTGLGKFSKGEGMIGLSRALLFAGAKNISVSLWSVADKSTSELMILFYKNLLNGMEKSTAMQAAKVEMINKGVAEANRKLSAFFWSPFILIGH